MDDQTDGWMDRQMDGWKDRWTDGGKFAIMYIKPFSSIMSPFLVSIVIQVQLNEYFIIVASVTISKLQSVVFYKALLLLLYIS